MNFRKRPSAAGRWIPDCRGSHGPVLRRKYWTAGALGFVLALSSCGDRGEPSDATPPPEPRLAAGPEIAPLTVYERPPLERLASVQRLVGAVTQDRGTFRLHFVPPLRGTILPCGCTKPPLGGADRVEGFFQRLPATGADIAVFWGDMYSAPESGTDPQTSMEQWRRRAEIVRAAMASTPNAVWLVAPELKAALAGWAPNTGEAPCRVVEATATGCRDAALELRHGGKSLSVRFAVVDQAEAGSEVRLSETAGDILIVYAGSSTRNDVRNTLRNCDRSFVACVLGAAPGDAGTGSSAETVGKVHIRWFDDAKATHVRTLAISARASGGSFADGTLLQLLEQIREGQADGDEDRTRREAADALAAEVRSVCAHDAVLFATSTPLSGCFASTGRVKELIADYRSWLRASFAATVANGALAGVTDGIAGPKACAPCHAGHAEEWAADAFHRDAYRTLVQDGREFDQQCFPCHATGFRGASSTPADLRRLGGRENVTCESCHGPRAKHAADPAGAGRGADPRASCFGCHDREHSPRFRADEPTFLARIGCVRIARASAGRGGPLPDPREMRVETTKEPPQGGRR